MGRKRNISTPRPPLRSKENKTLFHMGESCFCFCLCFLRGLCSPISPCYPIGMNQLCPFQDTSRPKPITSASSRAKGSSLPNRTRKSSEQVKIPALSVKFGTDANPLESLSGVLDYVRYATVKGQRSRQSVQVVEKLYNEKAQRKTNN